MLSVTSHGWNAAATFA